MKRIFKLSFVFILLFLILLLLLYFYYKADTISNLKAKKEDVDSKWIQLYENTNIRYSLLKTINYTIKEKGLFFDSLSSLLSKPLENRNFYKNECSLEFLKQEFDLNNAYLKYLLGAQSDNVLKETEIFNLIAKMKINDKETNLMIDNYNDYVLDYNKYISTFPHYVFAKKNGFTKKKYFTIKYGLENKDPILKSKELPEWAKGIDTL